MSQHSGDGAGGGVSTKILRIAFSFYRRFVAVTYFAIAIIEKEKRKTDWRSRSSSSDPAKSGSNSAFRHLTSSRRTRRTSPLEG